MMERMSLKIETIRMDYEDMKSKNVQLESELESFKTKLEMTVNELEKLKSENDVMKSSIESCRLRVDNVEQKSSDLLAKTPKDPGTYMFML